MNSRRVFFQHPVEQPIRFRELRLYRRAIFLRIVFYLLLLYSLLAAALPLLLADWVRSTVAEFNQTMSTAGAMQLVRIIQTSHNADEATTTVVYQSLNSTLPTTATIAALPQTNGRRLIAAIYPSAQFGAATEQFFFYLHQYSPEELAASSDQAPFEILAAGLLLDGEIKGYLLFDTGPRILEPLPADAEFNLIAELAKAAPAVAFNRQTLHEDQLRDYPELRDLELLNQWIRRAQNDEASRVWLNISGYAGKPVSDAWELKHESSTLGAIFLPANPWTRSRKFEVRHLFIEASVMEAEVDHFPSSYSVFRQELPSILSQGKFQHAAVKPFRIDLDNLDQVAGALVVTLLTSVSGSLLWLYYFIFVPLWAPAMFASRLDHYSLPELQLTGIANRSLVGQFLTQPLRLWLFGLIPVGAILLLTVPVTWLIFGLVGQESLRSIAFISNPGKGGTFYLILKALEIYPRILYYPVMGFILLYLGFRVSKNVTGRIILIVLLAVLIPMLQGLIVFGISLFCGVWFGLDGSVTMFQDGSTDAMHDYMLNISIYSAIFYLLLFIAIFIIALILKRRMLGMIEQRWLPE